MISNKETAIEKLMKKINHEYEKMRESWWDMTADELIVNAERIAAAKFIKANIGSCILDDGAEYLLGFKEPLAAIIETILYSYDPQNIAKREWFSDHLYDLYRMAHQVYRGRQCICRNSTPTRRGL